MKRTIAFGLGLLISGVSVLFLFAQVPLSEVLAQMQKADPTTFVAMLATYPLAMFVRTWRWRLLLVEPLGYSRALHINNINYFFNTVLPFRIGELARVVLLSREPRQTIGAGVSSVTVERLFDLMMALACVALGLALSPLESALPSSTLNALGLFLLMSLVGLGGLLFLPIAHPFLLRLLTFFSRLLPVRLHPPLLKFAQDTLDTLRTIATPRRLPLLFAASLLTWVVYVAFFHIGLLSFFGSAPLGLGILVTGLVALGIAAPSLPGAIGVFQAAAVLALSLVAYPTEVATSYAWALWLAQTSVILLGGVLGLSALSLNLAQFTGELRQLEDRGEKTA
jgi:uncharacterized protein (TIRG00374 family)